MIHFASAVRRCSESRTDSGAAYIPSTFRADYTTPTTIVRNRAPMGLSHHAPLGLSHHAPMGLSHHAPLGLSHHAPLGLIAQGGAPGYCISPLQGDATGSHMSPRAVPRAIAFRPFRATPRVYDLVLQYTKL